MADLPKTSADYCDAFKVLKYVILVYPKPMLETMENHSEVVEWVIRNVVAGSSETGRRLAANLCCLLIQRFSSASKSLSPAAFMQRLMTVFGEQFRLRVEMKFVHMIELICLELDQCNGEEIRQHVDLAREIRRVSDGIQASQGESKDVAMVSFIGFLCVSDGMTMML